MKKEPLRRKCSTDGCDNLLFKFRGTLCTGCITKKTKECKSEKELRDLLDNEHG